MDNSLIFISLIFVLTTIMCIALLYIASQKDKKLIYISIYWLIFQAILRISGAYQFLCGWFKLLFLLIPPIILIIYLFTTKKGKNFINQIDAKLLTVVHIYRIPLQLVFYTLFLNNTIAELVRPLDRNIEVFIGISSIIIYYFGCVKKYINKYVILFWNVLGLIILISVITNTNLSSPFPFQKFIIDPENWISYLYFPIVWLPSFMVPLFIFSHLAIIRQIIILKERF